MCVDTHKFRCCFGCCSLTTGTIIIGALYALGAIGSAISQQWIPFALEVVLAGIFSIVLCKPNSVDTRKLIYYVVAILYGLALIGWIIFVIYAFASDWEVDICTNLDSFVEGLFDSPYDCIQNINTWLWIFVVVYSLIMIPCGYCVLQILY